MTRVLIVEDQPIVLDGLKALLSREEDIKVVGDVQNGKEAMALMESTAVDVALLDIEMPGINGLDLTVYIKKNYPQTKVLILSMYKKTPYIKKAIENGADGYILKNNADQEVLIEAIGEVASGDFYFDREVEKIHFESMRRGYSPTTKAELTKREKEVLREIVAGNTSIEIGKKLFIAPATVETHKRNLFEKLQVKNIAALVNKAHTDGFLED